MIRHLAELQLNVLKSNIENAFTFKVAKLTTTMNWNSILYIEFRLKNFKFYTSHEMKIYYRRKEISQTA